MLKGKSLAVQPSAEFNPLFRAWVCLLNTLKLVICLAVNTNNTLKSTVPVAERGYWRGTDIIASIIHHKATLMETLGLHRQAMHGA